MDKEVKLTLKVDAAEAIKQTTASTKGMTKLEKAHKSYTDTLSAEGQEIRNINKSKQALKKRQDLEAQAANSAKGSYAQLSAQYRLNVIQLNSMGEAERKTSEKGKALTKETLGLRTAMADAKKETGDNTLNVGNYTDSVKDALAQTGMFGKLLAIQTKVQGAYAAAQRATTAATAEGVTGLKLFKIALISTGIGAIVVLIGTLVAAFASTQQGMDKVNKALAPLKGAFEAIKGVLQDLALNVFDQLIDRWTIAVESIALGVAKIRLKWNELTGDTEEVKELMTEIEEHTKNIKDAQDDLNKSVEDGKKIWEDANGRVKEGMEAQAKAYELGIKIRENDITLAKRKAIINDLLKENQKISRDSSVSDEDRLIAAQKAIDLTKALQKVDQEHLDMRIEKMQLEQSLNETDDKEKKELADLEAERISAATQQKATEIRLIEQKNTLEKSLAKERLDEIQAIEDAKAEARAKEQEFVADTEESDIDAIIEKEIADLEAIKEATDEWQAEVDEMEAETEEEKRQLKLDKLQEDYDADKAMLQKNLADGLILEEDYLKQLALLNKKHALSTAKLDKTTTKQKEMNQLDAAKVITSSMAQVFEDNKAMAAADAIVSGASAVVRTWEGYSPLGPWGTAAAIAQTAMIAATTTRQVGTITGVKFANGGDLIGASHAGGGIPLQEAEGGEFVVNKRAMANPQLRSVVETANAIGNGQGGSINTGVSEERVAEIASSVVGSVPVYIVESEMTEKQRIVKVRESEFNG